MMMALLAIARRKPFSVIHFTVKPFASVPQFHGFCSSSTNSLPKTSSDFIVDYLISSFGFSPDKAATVSNRIAHIKSPQKPDSVRHFLKHHGFTNPQIKTIITCRPEILSSSLEKTLEPNLRALREMGLSSAAVTQIVLSDPATLLYRNAVPRIKFWKDFLGGSEAALVRACRSNRSIAGQDIVPKISLLHSLGLSTHEIQRIILASAFINNSPALIKNLLSRAKELGFQPGSPMFVSGLRAISWNSSEAFQNKMELFKSYGWSEDVFFAALRKSPNIIHLTEKNLQTKMDFLIKEVRCDLSYLASNPWLMTFSLEKRLRPRFHVLHLLKSKCLSGKEYDLSYSLKMSDSRFVETYVLPHKEEISGLCEAYLSACA